MTIRLKTDTGLLCGYKACLRQPGKPEMAFVVRGRYRLAPGEPVRLRKSDEISEELVERTRGDSEQAAAALDEARTTLGQGTLSGDRFDEADESREGSVLYPSDLGDYKPKADVLLRATCHPPRRSDTECDVTFRVGAWKKSLKVIGHRVWVDRAGGGKHTEPKPIDAIRVDWNHAYGGPGFDENPTGKGHVERVDGEGDELYQPPRSLRSQVMPSQQLANVHHADGQALRDGLPAGFAALSPNWPFRQKKLGKKYDQEWLDTRAPCFAADMQWSYFNAAPPDQQLDALRGDEELGFENLHSAQARWTAKLPGQRVRVFVRDAEQNAREIAMKLDTLFADLEDGSLYLTWRGVTPVKEEDLTDVEFALIVTESLADPPHPLRPYLAQLEAFADDPVGLKAAFPAGLQEVATRMEQLEGASDQELEALLENAEGNSPPVAVVKNLLGPLAPAGLDRLDPTWKKAAALPEFDAPRARRQIRDGLDKMFSKGPNAPREGGDPSPPQGSVGMRIPVRDGEKPIFPIGVIFREQEKKLLEFKKRLPESAGVVAGQKIDAALEKIRNDPQLRAADPSYRPYREDDPPPDEPGPGANLLGRDLSDRDLSGVDLSGADLQCAILSRTSLKGANLAGAKLGGARLDRVDLRGADLSDVDLTSTSFDRVDARDAKLDRTRLDMFRASRCDFSGASFVGAEGLLGTFGKSRCVGSDFSKANFKLLTFDACELERARFGAKLEHVRFDGCTAPGIVLEGAELVGTSFNACTMPDAAASKVTGEGAIWFRTTLDGANFQRARLVASHFLNVEAPRASFQRAFLKGARFDRAILREASFDQANLLDADLRKTVLTKTTFRKACLHDAKITQAAGVDVDFEGADLEGANFQRSSLTTKRGGSR